MLFLHFTSNARDRAYKASLQDRIRELKQEMPERKFARDPIAGYAAAMPAAIGAAFHIVSRSRYCSRFEAGLVLSLCREIERPMKETNAALIGFGVASVVPPAVMAIGSPLSGYYDIGSILGTFAIACPFSLMATMFLGVPAFFLLRPFRPGHWWSVLAAGFILGVMVAVILRLPGPPNPHDFIPYGPIGALTVLVFWLIWRRSTPETGSDDR